MAVSDQSVATTGTQLDQLCINTIRTLSIDAVQKAIRAIRRTDGAGSGRLLPVQQFLRYDPEDPLGRTATVSCSPTDTRPCCSIPCCIWRECATSLADGKFFRLPPCRSMRLRISAN